MKFTVSKDTEIILDGQRYLLEAGDVIILEADVNVERAYRELAGDISKEFSLTADDIELIHDGLYGEINNYEEIKEFVRNAIRNDPTFNFKRITDPMMYDILKLIELKDWKSIDIKPEPKAFDDNEKAKFDKEREEEKEKLRWMFNPDPEDQGPE